MMATNIVCKTQRILKVHLLINIELYFGKAWAHVHVSLWINDAGVVRTQQAYPELKHLNEWWLDKSHLFDIILSQRNLLMNFFSIIRDAYLSWNDD